ncbi:MAG: hypothetical protein DMF69_11160 [Acidobacteria bacterium]|nr:MAG: hypothetical protein DMF69_11160 [Acidobacteriota bacterium]
MIRWIQMGLLVCFCTALTQAQSQTSTKIYRGSLGNKHIEMQLEVTDGKVTGTYFYDQFKQEIKLEGSFDAKGELTLIEGPPKRPTGKFVCKAPTGVDQVDRECEWTRPTGTGNQMVFLNEQGISPKTAIRFSPKLINDRKNKVYASYPQITAITSIAINEFNSLVQKRVEEKIKTYGFDPDQNSSFDTNYLVTFADRDLVSVEFESTYNGGAHPTVDLWTINYNLKTNKELTLDDVFRPGGEYKQAIAEFVVKDINRRADEFDRDDARQNKTEYKKRDEPLMTLEQLPEMETWGLSPKGFVVYFGFPHVMAVFTKTVVPISVVSRDLRPDGVIPLVR